MRFAKIVFIAAGVWGIVVLTPLYFLLDLTGRQYAPANYVSAVLLRLSVDHDGVADRLSGDRVEPVAIPAADDPEHSREGRLHRDSRGVARPVTHFNGGRRGCRARPAAVRPLHRRVCEDAGVGTSELSERLKLRDPFHFVVCAVTPLVDPDARRVMNRGIKFHLHLSASLSNRSSRF